MKRLSFLLLLTVLSAIYVSAQGPVWTVDDLLHGKRVSDPQVSPDGQWVAYTVGDLNWDGNRYVNQVYVARIGGGTPQQVTKTDKGAASQPRWSPDGKRIAYVTGGQLWTMKPDGSDTVQITTLSSGAGQPVWSPDSHWLLFSSDVYPECSGDDACNKRKDDAADANKMKAHTTDRLLFRHWTGWTDVKRTHVFVVAAEKNSRAREVTTGDWDAPPYGAASGSDYAFSPDGREIAYLRNPDKVEAISTNSDIYVVPTAGGEARNITVSNKGYEFSPVYTPDGKYIIYRSQATPAFEADRTRLMRYDRATGASTELTTGFDLQVDEFILSQDGSKIFFTAGDRGHIPIFSIPVAGGKPNKIWNTVSASGLNNALNGSKLVFVTSSIAEPGEIVLASNDGTQTGGRPYINVTTANQPAGLAPAEELTWTGAMKAQVHGFIIKPKNFDPNKKYPLLVIIHGGPQSAFYDSWGYRWNPQVFANQGYVVFMPNPRGSVGYGQKFVNDVSADWGGKAATDIRNGVAEVIKRSYVDKNRIGAAGASYGGYMVDWMMGHNTDPRFHFKVFLSHAGVYNLESMIATEEQWFNNWEFKGQPWTNPVMFNTWSPHKFAKNFNTPTLVTCGEIDYRVPYTQSLELYTTLQLKGIESKLIVFPDEGHWILKPQNSKYWYSQAIDWFDKHLK
ncbi:MAG TPA: S9 family peptidase [Pyrinomonadaceae bacterium]|jgi:dipeptidyl aminopeptidase/acylaminoacyl peptidase|nr:S9 family peptidase [Pyrinomonadaceae bacterium]